MSEISYDSFIPQPAVLPYVVNGRYEPSSAGPYPLQPDRADRSHDLPPWYRQDNRSAFDATAAYLSSIIPGLEVQPLSNVGTTSVVMHDSTTAYKVRREQSADYCGIEDEAAALTVLSKEGIAPSLRLLIDAGRQWRTEGRQRHSDIPIFQSTIRIPRVEGPGRLAVLATELKEIGSIAELPVARVGLEFNKFALTALRLGLYYEDCEFHYDRRAKSAVVVDVGHVCQVDVKDKGVGLVHDTFGRFLPPAYRLKPSYDQVSAILNETGELDALHPLLHEYRELNS